jgi:hypothetical protein
MRTPGVALSVLILACCVLPACGQPPPETEAIDMAPSGTEREAWTRVLSDFARDGGMDYAGLQARPEDLEAFLDSLAAVRPETLDADEALAFWSNAYNAVVLRHVLDRYPEIESVKSVDGFFSSLTFPVAGADRPLDEIEARGRDLGDARIHFAVVCASTSCPDLLDEPYRGQEIGEQLDRQTGRFLADPSKGMRFDRASGTLWLSSIFKWYAGDFTGGSTVVAYFSRGGVAGWVRRQLPKELAAEIGDSPKVRYLDYDWSLNDRPAE